MFIVKKYIYITPRHINMLVKVVLADQINLVVAVDTNLNFFSLKKRRKKATQRLQ